MPTARSLQKMKQFVILRFTPTLIAIALLLLFGAAADLPTPDRWEKTIQAFEKKDKEQAPPQDAILFYGSSSIVGWDVQKSFPNLTVIKRGFGGSMMREATHFADRIAIPYKPRAIVLYEGDNDLAKEITADELFADYKAFVTKIHGALPETKILFLSVKPSIARWKLIDEQRKANKLIEEHAKTDKRLMYVDVGSALLGPDGQPRKDLLKDDGLHLNEEGYKVWTGILTPILAEIAK